MWVDEKGKRIGTIADPWGESLFTSEPVICEIFNSMEDISQWVTPLPDWTSVQKSPDGWTLPVALFLPVIGRVITFDLCARQFSAGAWDVTLKNLNEEKPAIARILRIDVFPNWGVACHGEEGYLFLPSYCGVLHEFNHSVSREIRMAIYARQEQWPMHCNSNCFGIKTPRLSMCAVVIEGEFDAEVVARSHWEENSLYSIHVAFVYRWAEHDSLETADRTVRYHLLDPVEDGWCAYARAYRSVLRNEHHLQTLNEKRANRHVLEYLSESFLIKIFQGHKEITTAGDGGYHSCTSFLEAQDILKEMKGDGIEKITVQMVGWNCEGHDGRYPQRFPVNETEGGEDGFRKLIQWAREQNILLSVHDNCYDAYRKASIFDEHDLVILRDGNLWRNIPWSGGHSYKICPLRGRKYLEGHFSQMRDLGIDGHYYFDALGAFYPCKSPEHPANRSVFLNAMRDLLLYTQSTFGSLNVELPFGPYFDIIDGTYLDDNVSYLDTYSDFRKNWIDRTVPFLAVVLHNGVRYQSSGGGKCGLARALRDCAIGAMPFIEICSRPISGIHAMPTYDSLREYAQAAWYLSCKQNLDRIFVDIENIEELEPDIWVTLYADGIKLITNCTDRVVTVEGNEVDGFSILRI